MEDEVVRLARISDEPLDVATLCEAVRTDASGARALFVGVVRDHDHGRRVTALEYSAHPDAERVMREVVADVAEASGAHAVAAVHRVGDLRIGDLAVVVAVSSAHRADAFAVCSDVIDAIKSRVPIWKRQEFADGTQEWVGSP